MGFNYHRTYVVVHPIDKNPSIKLVSKQLDLIWCENLPAGLEGKNRFRQRVGALLWERHRESWTPLGELEQSYLQQFPTLPGRAALTVKLAVGWLGETSSTGESDWIYRGRGESAFRLFLKGELPLL